MRKCSVILCLLQAFLLVSSKPFQDDGIQGSSSSLIFDSQTITVNPEQTLDLRCGVQGDYRSCIWEKEETEQSIQVADVHEGYLRGMSKPADLNGNQCGIVIDTINPLHHGTWICKVFVRGNTLRGSKKVTVTIKPSRPSLNVNENPIVVHEGETKDPPITCSVDTARPAARFSWYIGEKDITSQSDSIDNDKDQDIFGSVSTLRYKFDHSDHRQMLKCMVNHVTLQEPLATEIPMDIRHVPYSLSSSQIYSIPIEETYEIQYNFSANPLPELRWYTGQYEIPIPGQVDRYEAKLKQLPNAYQATLKIFGFTRDDVGTTYKLIAGNKEFDVSLSTGPAPPESMGTGSVIAITIVVLIIVCLILLIFVMRARQMYCFAMRAESKAYIQDPDRGDLESCRTNDAIKSSIDHINGRPESGLHHTNGNGNGIVHTDIEAITRHHYEPFEKRNTDV